MPKDGYYFDYLEDSYSDEYTDVDAMQFETWTEKDFRFIEKTAEDLYRNTSKALVGDFGINLGRPFSFQEWMIALLTEKEYIKEYYDKKSDHIITILESYREAVTDRIAIIFFGHDFGTQKGELISPQIFDEMVAPYYRKIFFWIRENTNWKVLFHTCGSVFNIIPRLIDIGVDILNPVQTSAARMDPALLKETFGNRIIFWGGGVDTQKTLPFGSVEEVREEVQTRIKVLGKGGGFIFNPVHNIQKGVPPENIAACYDTAFESGAVYG
jgi:uroporphyrinogen-III decarboxylase